MTTEHQTSTTMFSGVRRKSSWGFHSVACDGYLYLVCAFCDVTIWPPTHVSKPTLWRCLL